MLTNDRLDASLAASSSGLHPRPDVLLVSAREASALCGKSLRTWRTWDAGGLIPRPVRIGRSTFWRTEELRDWVAAGCPRRLAWEAQSDLYRT